MSARSVHITWNAVRGFLAVTVMALALVFVILTLPSPADAAVRQDIGWREAVVSSVSTFDEAGHDEAHCATICQHGQCAHSTPLIVRMSADPARTILAARLGFAHDSVPASRTPIPPARPPRA